MRPLAILGIDPLLPHEKVVCPLLPPHKDMRTLRPASRHVRRGTSFNRRTSPIMLQFRCDFAGALGSTDNVFQESGHFMEQHLGLCRQGWSVEGVVKGFKCLIAKLDGKRIQFYKIPERVYIGA
jgi:hypothetical protein